MPPSKRNAAWLASTMRRGAKAFLERPRESSILWESAAGMEFLCSVIGLQAKGHEARRCEVQKPALSSKQFMVRLLL